MKQIITSVLVSAAISLSACGQKLDASKVPAPVKESFTKQFPETKAKWEKEDEKYEASFKNMGNEMTATFEANGSMTESEMEIKTSELPASVTGYIKVKYNTPIKEAAKITTASGEVQYEAEIKGKDLIFDASGNFIKEIKL